MNNKDLIEEYNLFLKTERKLSKNTSDNYLLDINNLINSLNKPIKKIDENDILNYLKKSNVCASSKNRKISSFNMFFKFLRSEKYLTNNPMQNIKTLKTPRLLPKYLSIEEVDKLLDIKLETDFDYRNKAMLELMYATGLRVGEVVNLTISDIDLFTNIFRRTQK